MKYFVSVALIACLCGCDLTPKTYAAEIDKMQDTLFKSFPTVNRASVEVKNDFGSEIIITLGDAELYGVSDAEKTEVVKKVTAITESIFAPEDRPGKGEVIFVPEEQTIQVNEATKKSFKMELHKK